MYTTEAPTGAIVRHDNFLGARDVDILVDQGHDLATRKFFSQFNIKDGISTASNSINIRPADGIVSFKMGTPLEIQYHLKSLIHLENIHVIYHTQISKTESETGILSSNSYHIENSTMTFKVKYFGNYQIVRLSPPIKRNLIKRSTDLIFKSKDNKYRLLPANWQE